MLTSWSLRSQSDSAEVVPDLWLSIDDYMDADACVHQYAATDDPSWIGVILS